MEEEFAKEDNLEHAIHYLNSSLHSLGFSHSISLQNDEKKSMVTACNCIYSILIQRRKDINFKESVNDNQQKITYDMNRLQGKVERLNNQLSMKEKEIQSIIVREQKSIANLQSQVAKLRSEKEEYQKMSIGSIQQKNQLVNELKKKEKEYIRIQEKIHSILNEKKKLIQPGIDIKNLSQTQQKERATWTEKKKIDEKFYKMLINGYETKKKEMVLENSELKYFIKIIQENIDHLLEDKEMNFDFQILNSEKSFHEDWIHVHNFSADFFEFPFEFSKNHIKENIKNKLKIIQCLIAESKRKMNHLNVMYDEKIEKKDEKNDRFANLNTLSIALPLVKDAKNILPFSRLNEWDRNEINENQSSNFENEFEKKFKNEFEYEFENEMENEMATKNKRMEKREGNRALNYKNGREIDFCCDDDQNVYEENVEMNNGDDDYINNNGSENEIVSESSKNDFRFDGITVRGKSNPGLSHIQSQIQSQSPIVYTKEDLHSYFEKQFWALKN